MINKQRKIFFKHHILIIPTRNIDSRHRHFMQDIINILPHSKKTDKIPYEQLSSKIPAICEQYNCHAFLVFRTIGDQLAIIAGNYPQGPTIQFKVLNINTMSELQLAGNFSKKGRALLSFDKLFESNLKYQLVKELLTSIFTVPQPRFTDNFVDRLASFQTEGEAQNRIWFRLYEILDKDLREIGPRFVLELTNIIEGFFTGQILYQGSLLQGQQTQKKKIRKSEKKMEKLIQELNLKEEEIDGASDENPELN